MVADLAPQIDQIIAGIAADLRQIGGMAMAGDDIGGGQWLHLGVPCFHPTGSAGAFKNRRHAFVKGNIPRDQNVPIGDPDLGVAGAMGGAHMQHLDPDAAHFDVIVVAE